MFGIAFMLFWLSLWTRGWRLTGVLVLALAERSVRCRIRFVLRPGEDWALRGEEVSGVSMKVDPDGVAQVQERGAQGHPNRRLSWGVDFKAPAEAM